MIVSIIPAVVASFVVIVVCALTIGWIFSGTEAQRGIARWDEAGAEFGRDIATDTTTGVLGAITDLGGTVPLLSVLTVIGIWFGIRRKDWSPAIYLAVVGVGSTLLSNGLKLIVDRPRPDIAQLAGHAGSSFPSGHSTAAAACWAAAALVVTRRRSVRTRSFGAVIAVFIALSVAVTRVLLGVHWISDVAAGVVLGWSWFVVTTLVFGGRLCRLDEPAERLTARLSESSRHRARYREEALS